MGCDIHVFAEQRSNSVWRRTDPMPRDLQLQDPFLQQHPEYITCEPGRGFYDGRWYQLFGALAGVRDAAGANLYGGRGIPDDVSPVVRGHAEEWGPDGHSHSWATLEELRHPDLVALADHSDEWARMYEGLKRVAWSDDESRVRLVFWFDN